MILVYSGFGSHMILVYSGFGSHMILVYSGFGLDKFYCLLVITYMTSGLLAVVTKT